MKFIDLFAGIGGFREGLEREGFECVGWCEFDKFKQQAYRAVHDTKGEWHKDDIKSIRPEELPEADIYTGGFPCQSFSIAGNRGGFEDTRGTLFFEIARLAKERQPKYLLLENVRGLLSHDGGKTFATILQTLWDIGYDIQWQVLNSKDFGVPQNRERIFIVGHLRGQPRPKIFPIRETSKRTLKELTRGMSQGYRVYDADGLSVTLAGEAGGLGAKTGLYFINQPQYGKYKLSKTSDTLTAKGKSSKQKIIKKSFGIRNYKEWNEKGDGVSNCLDTNYAKFPDNRGARTGIISNNKIRKLTPLETFRLQGFPDEWYHKCREEGISDTQMYRAAGDSVTVNVVQEIGRRLKGGRQK